LLCVSADSVRALQAALTWKVETVKTETLDLHVHWLQLMKVIGNEHANKLFESSITDNDMIDADAD